ncbi:MAG: VTT domain-containing protein [Dehalococcoidales bacterium]|nr:VTT domain-containing protein [Dehalococcoidales bacterium]
MKTRQWLKTILKTRVLPILAITLVVLITVGIFRYHDKIAAMGYYSYPSVFLLSMIWNATVLVPIPGFPIYFLLGTIFNPLLVGLAGGCGAAVGEMTSYMAGYSGQAMLRKRKINTKIYTRIENWVKKREFRVIFALNLVPFFPLDLAAIAAGVLRLPLWKFYLATAAGRSVAYGFVAFAGSRGWVPPIPFLQRLFEIPQ